MACKVLILGASYGSLLGTKLLMAGHDVTLVCRQHTADLINLEGTEVRIKLKGEDRHRAIRSNNLPGRLTARAPNDIVAAEYDLVGSLCRNPSTRTTPS
jgi:ketopantoate reductase